MHNYSLNTDNRKNAIIIIMVISFILNSLLYSPMNLFIDFLGNKIGFISVLISQCDKIGISISQVSVLGIFGIIYFLYIKFLWKTKVFKKLHNIPDLNGEWNGSYLSSYIDDKGQPKMGGCNVTIKQDWNKISIKCEFGESSSSYSKTASLYVDDIEGSILTFTYINDSNNPNWKTRKHDGCNIFHCKDGALKGKYFTDRGDGTHGKIQLVKTEPINEKVNIKKEFN